MPVQSLKAACLSLFVLLAACAGPIRPDLERLYANTRQTIDQPPVIFIPGLMGTRLRDPDSGKDVWPGRFVDLFFDDQSELALDIDPASLLPMQSKLEPYAIADRIGGNDFYATILQTLETAGGYRRAIPGTRPDPRYPSYYVFPYDWRYDNVLTARRLSAFIEQIRIDHGAPDLEVDIVGHSMGGLIARYYLRYGERDVLDGNDFPVSMHGRSRIRRLILLGTPNLGSVESLKSFIAGRRKGLTTVPTEVLMTLPSLYQLFPHALNDWLISADGEPLERDQFDIEIWRRFQWSLFDPRVRARITAAAPSAPAAQAHLALLERYFERHLEHARRLLWSLTVPVTDPLPLIVFGGDCELTPARLLVEEVAGESVLRLWPDDIKHRNRGIDYHRLMLEPGDSLVTKASLLGRTELDPRVPRHRHSHFPLDYGFFLCEQHSALPGSMSFLDNLLNALLSRDR